MKYSDYTDEALIGKLREGEKDVENYIMRKYMPLVRKSTNAMYLIGGEKEDLIQEGMMGLMDAVRNYNPEREASFFTFAELCITRHLNSVIEASNRKKHAPLNNYISFSNQDEADGVDLEQIISDQSIGPEQILIEKERKKEFFIKLEEKLSSMEKKVLYLYLEGNDYLQIAEIMQKSSKSIDNALQRIRAKGKLLKEEL